MTKCAMITGLDYSTREITTCQEEGTVKDGTHMLCEKHSHHALKEWKRDIYKDGSFQYTHINQQT